MSPQTAHHALLCGLAMLIPLPWVDEYVERRITRALLRNVAVARATPVSEDVLHTLTEDRSNLVVGCLVAAIVWPIKKLFRTVFYFFTMKDFVDTVARAAHRATLFELALDRGLLPGRAEEVRSLMDTLLRQHRVSPVTRTLWRHDRPDLVAIEGTDPAVRAVRWLQRHGGGGVLIDEFQSRTAEWT